MNNKMFRIGAVIVFLLLVFFLINRAAEKAAEAAVVELVTAKQAETDQLAELAAKKEAEEKAAEVADLAAKEESSKKAAVEKAKLAVEAAKKAEKARLAAEAAKKAEEEKATAKVALAELTAELAAAEMAAEAAVVELTATKIAFAKLSAEKIAAEEIAAEEKARLAAEAAKKAEEARKAELENAIAQLAVDCQAKYDESQAAYKDGNLEANITLKREILGMGCDEELSSQAQYYIGWTYGNKLFNMYAARAEYQKGANNYSSGLKYVEKCEEKLALYKKNDEIEAVYKAGDFAKAAALREEVGMTKGCDKALAAKNLYQAGYIHQTKLNDNARAKALYEAVVINFSGSEYGDKAKQKLATL
jgi:hypothetical protein